MESVAVFLQRHANGCAPESLDFDLFGRSSFNRYYYAAYLQVRDLLGSLDPSWISAQHKSIPDLLNGSVLSAIKKKRNRATKIGDAEAIQICSRADTSARELASMMRKAYAVRVTADYNPEIRVERQEGGRFKLNLVSVNDAHGWPTLAKEYGENIKRAWNLGDA